MYWIKTSRFLAILCLIPVLLICGVRTLDTSNQERNVFEDLWDDLLVGFGVRTPARVLVYPEPEDILLNQNLPPLTFPGWAGMSIEDLNGHVSKLKQSMLGTLTNSTRSGNIQNLVGELSSYFSSIREMNTLMANASRYQFGVPEAKIIDTISILKHWIPPFRAGLNGLLSSNSNAQRLMSFAVAIHTGRKISSVFTDQEHFRSGFKAFSAPYFVAFTALHTAMVQLASDLHLPHFQESLLEEKTLDLENLKEFEEEMLLWLREQITSVEINQGSGYDCRNLKFLPLEAGKSNPELEAKAELWRFPQDTENSGCVQGRTSSAAMVQDSDVEEHNHAEVFVNKITGDVFCGFSSCYNNLKETYSNRIRNMFLNARELMECCN